MNVKTQLLGHIQDMNQEQLTLLCDFVDCSSSELSKKLFLLPNLSEVTLSREKMLDCMLAFIFESIEKDVSPEVIFNALYPIYSLIRTNNSIS